MPGEIKTEGHTAPAWDHLVDQSVQGHLLQTWAWGILKAEFGWQAQRLWVEQDGVPVAGAQVLIRKVGPLSMAYIPKGPVLLSQEPDHIETLWRGIHHLCRQQRSIYCKVEPELPETSGQPLPWPSTARFEPVTKTVQPRRTIMVDLTADEDTILGRMKSKWRYNVRLAARKGVEVREGAVDDVALFHRLMTTTGERDAFGIHREAYYRRAFELFAPLGRVRLLLAYYEGQPLAGLMVFTFNSQSWYMYGASASHHRELMPNHLLQWQAMQWAKAQGCRQYDLWGITETDEDDPEADLAGVERFKRGFGGEVVRYVGAFDYVYSRPLYTIVQKVLAWR